MKKEKVFPLFIPLFFLIPHSSILYQSFFLAVILITVNSNLNFKYSSQVGVLLQALKISHAFVTKRQFPGNFKLFKKIPENFKRATHGLKKYRR